MTTLISPPPNVAAEPDHAGWIVLPDVSWELYDRLLEEIGDGHVRITYHEGRMEMMYPSGRHEGVKTCIGRLIEAYALEADIPVFGLGSVTCRRGDLEAGLEPDECYYVTTPVPPLDNKALDLAVQPPPDLAIEIDVTHSSVPRVPIYGALGVPEVWRFDGQRVLVLVRQPDGSYKDSNRSGLFPNLPMDVFNGFLQQAMARTPHAQHQAAKALRDWVRART